MTNDTINTRTLLLLSPPLRTHPLGHHELEMLETAYGAWSADEVYVDGKGNYRLKECPRRIVAWNKVVKALFPNNLDFHRAAQLHKNVGVVTDPTQAPRFVSSSNGTTVGLRVVRGNNSDVELATITPNDTSSSTITNAFEIADLLIDAINHYITDPHGYYDVASLLNKIDSRPTQQNERINQG